VAVATVQLETVEVVGPRRDSLDEAHVHMAAIVTDQPHVVLAFHEASNIEYAPNGCSQSAANAVLLGRLHSSVTQRHDPLGGEAAGAHAVRVEPRLAVGGNTEPRPRPT